jgi:hypothetical protein
VFLKCKSFTTFLKTLYWYFRKQIFKRDFRNLIFFGLNAPKFAELLYVKTSEINFILEFQGLNVRALSGKIVDDAFWNSGVLTPFAKHYKYIYCVKHWKNNISWKDAGAYDFLFQQILENGSKIDNCLTYDDVILRYDNLDILFDSIKRKGRLLTKNELDPCHFRENQGILMHFGPDGKPYFGGGGFHRLTIAKLLELDEIPVQVGIVHINAIKLLKRSKN